MYKSLSFIMYKIPTFTIYISLCRKSLTINAFGGQAAVSA